MTARVRGPRADEGGEYGRRTVVAAVPAELRVVKTIDGNGKAETKLMLVIPIEGGNPLMFYMPKGFDASMEAPSGWVQEQVKELLATGFTTPQEMLAAPPEAPVGLETIADSLPKPPAVNVMKKPPAQVEP